MTTVAALTSISTADLVRLSAQLGRWPREMAVTRAALAAARLDHLWETVRALGVSETTVLTTVVQAVLAERQAQIPSRVELVWTGLEAKTGYGRPTAAVVRELFDGARRHVLIAGYSFDHGDTIFEPLHRVMVALGVEVDIYLHIERARSERQISKHVAHEIASFFAANWPFGTTHPTIYIAPRTVQPSLHESLHAKCVVVDETAAVIGSANFTDRGQSRNIEVGAKITDPGFAQALVAQFRTATNAGIFERFAAGSANCAGDCERS